MNAHGRRRRPSFARALLILAVLAASFYGTGFRPDLLLTERAVGNAGRFLRDCWPPYLEDGYVLQLCELALDTLATAFLGTVAAVLIGFPLGVFGSRSAVFGALFVTGETRRGPLTKLLYLTARGISALLRSIPELVWAFLFVRLFSLGPTPAVLGIGINYGGMLGKVYSEQLEDQNPTPAAAIEATGASRFSAFWWGLLPQASGAMSAYTAYRFECAVRASAIMGFVGAGGIGQEIQLSMQYFQFDRVLSGVLVLVLLVALIELLSDAVQRRFA